MALCPLSKCCHQSFCLVLSLSWSVLRATWYAVLAAWSSGFAVTQLWQECFFLSSSWQECFFLSSSWQECFFLSSSWICSSASSDQCLVVTGQQADSYSRGFLAVWSSSASTVLHSAAVTQWSLSSNMTWRLFFHPWIMKFVYLQFLRVGTFPLWRKLEGKGDFATYQPMISVTLCTGHPFFLKTFYNTVVPVGFLPWEIRVAFLRESQLRQSHATQPRMLAGCFGVSIIHWTLTWTTGFFNMRTDVNTCNHTLGCTDTIRESALKVDWEKNPWLHRGIKPALAVCQSNALPTELHPHPLVCSMSLMSHCQFKAWSWRCQCLECGCPHVALNLSFC